MSGGVPGTLTSAQWGSRRNSGLDFSPRGIYKPSAVREQHQATCTTISLQQLGYPT